jgi:hypothetical protein
VPKYYLEVSIMNNYYFNLVSQYEILIYYPKKIFWEIKGSTHNSDRGDKSASQPGIVPDSELFCKNLVILSKHNNTIKFSKSLLHVFLYPFLGVQIPEKSSLNLKIKITRQSTCVHIVNNIRKHKFKPPPPLPAKQYLGFSGRKRIELLTIYKFKWD